MNKIILLSFLLINLSYTNCSACSQNTLSTTDEECFKLAVDDEKTQVCIKHPSSNGCKQTNLCIEKTKEASNEICSKLRVSSNNFNTHVCIMSNEINLVECQKILKQKYNLPADEELMIIKGDILNNMNEIGNFGNSGDFQIFSTSLGAFLPLAKCFSCKEEDLCTNVKYVDSDEKCSKLKPISFNLNTNYLCIKNPEPNTNNCIETNKCTDIKIGGTNEKCGRLNSSNGKLCVKDQSSNGCKETDLCQEVKYIFSTDKCSSLKVSDNSYMKCVIDFQSRSCVEQKYKCEERETINNVSEELCNKLETNDNTEKCIKNNNGNNCILIKYCNYGEGANNKECGKFPVQNKDNICVRKDKENKCEEINKNDINKETTESITQNKGKNDEDSQNKNKNDVNIEIDEYSLNIHYSLYYGLIFLLFLSL